MTLDAGRLRDLLTKLHPGKLSPADAETVVALSQLSVDADGHEDAAEIQLFFTLGKAVFERAGLSETPTPTISDEDEAHERMRELASKLATTDARELAYAVAHVLTVVDVAISPEEDHFLEELGTALAITPDRAHELAALASEAITPAE